MEVYGVIYKLTNNLNCKAYVGQTTRSIEVRFREHAVADSRIGNAIRKYGAENFSCEVVEECESRAELDEREIFWIAHFDCKSPNGYNLTDGGEGGSGLCGEDSYWFGKNLPAEACVKMADAKRADTPYKNLLNAMIEQKFSYGKLAKLMGTSQPSLSMKMRDLRQFSEEDVATLVGIFGLPAEYLFERDDGQPLVLASRSGENNPFYGKHHTGETRMESAANNRGNTPYKNLRVEMDNQQISYRNLAKLLGVSQANISRKISGLRKFTNKDVARLVEIFNKPVAYLLARDDGLEATPTNRGKSSYENLLKEIINHKLTYTALGELLGLSHQSVSEKMHGKKNFTAKDIAKLVEIFSKPAEYLMARDDG